MHKKQSKHSFTLIGAAFAACIVAFLLWKNSSPEQMENESTRTAQAEEKPLKNNTFSEGVKHPEIELSGARKPGPAPHKSEPTDAQVEYTVDLQEPIPFDPEVGPYTREYFDSLPIEKVIEARRALRKLQAKEKAIFLSEVSELSLTITSEEYNAHNLVDGDDIYLPRFDEGEIKHFFVDRLQYEELYNLRDKALIIQSSRPFIDHLEKQRAEQIDSLLANPDISNLETVISPNNDLFVIYGTVDGERIVVGGSSSLASM